MNKFERAIINHAIAYLHAKNYEESKWAKLKLFEVTANYEHRKAKLLPQRFDVHP